MSEERPERSEKTQDAMQADVASLEERQDSPKAGQEDLGRLMLVLHEDLIRHIEAIPKYSGPTKQEFEQGLADFAETIGGRIDRLVVAVRRLSGS